MSKPRDLGLLPPPAQRASFRSRNVSGMTLIELMVALAIGSFLLLGAVTVFVQSQAAFRVNEASARLQENARFALGAIEPDIRMAYYLGLTTRPDRIRGRASPDDPVAFAVGGDCGPNWTVNLDAAIDGTNNVYGWSCTPYAGAGAMAGSDTLVVRRVEEAPGAPAPNRLQVQSARFQEGELFVGPDVPEGYSSETSATYRLVVNGYYVSPTSSLSTADNPVPSLRVKTLIDGPRIEDREVLPGVEDMQVQFGIDTDPPDTPGRGAIDRYVNPGDPLLDRSTYPDVRVLAVRVWLRIRSERPEPDFTDSSSYAYADRSDDAPNDGYRRIVVSKTIYLRNARPAS
ncbi:MAG: PilW family protein [Gammaproteobacteria bacterium]